MNMTSFLDRMWEEFIGAGRVLGRGKWSEVLLAVIVELPYGILVFSSPHNVWDSGGLQSLYDRVNNHLLALPFLIAAAMTIASIVRSNSRPDCGHICYLRFAGGILSFVLWGWMSLNVLIEHRGNYTSLIFYVQSALIGLRALFLACLRR